MAGVFRETKGLGVCGVASVLLGLGVAGAEEVSLEASYQKEILPIFENYCYDCHGDGLKKGDLALDRYGDISSMVANREVWKRVRDHIDFRLMPPPDEPAPSEVERAKLLKWIDSAVFPVDLANPDPGQVSLRRLNRVEYQRTIFDLLGVSVDVAEMLPPDDSGYGFDNNGDVLTLSPLHVERYLETARAALDAATHLGEMPRARATVSGEKLGGDGAVSTGERLLFSNGQAFANFQMTTPGRYRIEVVASGEWLPKCDLVVDGDVVKSWEVRGTRDAPETLSHEVTIEGGRSVRVAAFFTNDVWDPENPDPARRDRNLAIHRLSVEGPLDGPPPEKPATHRAIYGERRAGQTDADYMDEVLARFARRAFRRAVSKDEMARYGVFLELAKRNGESVEVAIRQALEAMLVSPAFLFREEPVVAGKSGGKSLISEDALASRLSYFLWSTMPDEPLLRLAAEGKLRENLASEVRRMMASEKFQGFIENFVGQWLQLRDMDSIYPNPKVFPAFSSKLARDMRKETEMLVSETIKQDLPVMHLLDANYTFLNERLAKHYGMAGVTGKEFRKVSLEGTPRRGILTQGAFLTLTSYPNRTSPVLRGKYVLENILDTPPPPPPPNIPQLTGKDEHGKSLPMRQQLERHRDDPACSSCHALMDPIGFALDSYDGIGTWRDTENGLPLHTAGKLVTGQTFANAEQLREILTRDFKPEFHRALATKLLTYALGRGLDWYDRPTLDGIVKTAGTNEVRFHSLIQAIVDSVPFQYRR